MGIYTKIGCQNTPQNDELIWNYTFNCGLDYWRSNNYNAILTNNGDGSVHLESTENFSSIVPDYLPTASETYVFEFKVRNVTGNGKMSVQLLNNTWIDIATYNTDGVYGGEFTGQFKSLDTGAATDPTFECDFDYISVKIKV